MDWATTTAMPVFHFAFTIGLMTLIYGTLLYIAVSELAECFRRRRSATAAKQLLDSVRDVPYLPLPDRQASSCVICIAEYGRGEGRLVLPGCGHAFHRGCIAEWLRRAQTTCPICRAAAIVGPPAGEEKVAAAAVSTAEDMV